MSGKGDMLQSLAAEMAHTGRLRPDTVTDWTRRAQVFERWNEQNTDGTVDEMTVLGYLIAHDHLAWATLKTDVQAVDWYYSRAATPSPVGPLIRAFLHEKRVRDGRSRLPKVLPLRITQAVQIAETLDRADARIAANEPMITAVRAIVAAARRTADPASHIATALVSLVRPGALHVQPMPQGPDLLSVQAGSPRIELPLTTHQRDQWTSHLQQVISNPAAMRRRLQQALNRTRIAPVTLVGDLSEEQWEWMWVNAAPGTYLRVRDLAYLLVGLSHARRHIELASLQIENVYDDDDGYLIWYGRTKNGHGHSAVIRHTADEPRHCPPACPACALAALLEYAKICQGRTTGPLFATSYGGRFRSMTRQNGRHRIRKMTEVAFGQPWGSTRSLRSGAATSAAEMGWTIDQMTALTGHRDVNQLEVYIHRSDTPSDTLQLDLSD